MKTLLNPKICELKKHSKFKTHKKYINYYYKP